MRVSIPVNCAFRAARSPEDPGARLACGARVRLDDSPFLRPSYVLGHEAMKKMAVSNVLIIGMKGLGVEIGEIWLRQCVSWLRDLTPSSFRAAKNVVLAGVKSVTIFDSEPAAIADLSSQYFIHEADLGKRRDVVTLPRLAELNAYVPVSILSGEFELSKLDQFQVRRFPTCSMVTTHFFP